MGPLNFLLYKQPFILHKYPYLCFLAVTSGLNYILHACKYFTIVNDCIQLMILWVSWGQIIIPNMFCFFTSYKTPTYTRWMTPSVFSFVFILKNTESGSTNAIFTDKMGLIKWGAGGRYGRPRKFPGSLVIAAQEGGREHFAVNILMCVLCCWPCCSLPKKMMKMNK